MTANERTPTAAWAGLFLLVLTLSAFGGRPGKILYENNFDKSPPGQLPDGEFLVLDGDFSIKDADGNKFAELPGAPLENFGALFGPTTNSGVCVSARIFGTGKGRRYPRFGVGLNGQNGFLLKVSPAKDAVEIYKGDESVASVPFRWKSGTWTEFKLRVRPNGAQAWVVEGKVWPQGEPEPKDWMVTFEEKTEPHAGRASFWGSPYSGTPIRFDDLLLSTE